jgi:hypothetical protein
LTLPLVVPVAEATPDVPATLPPSVAREAAPRISAVRDTRRARRRSLLGVQGRPTPDGADPPCDGRPADGRPARGRGRGGRGAVRLGESNGVKLGCNGVERGEFNASPFRECVRDRSPRTGRGYDRWGEGEVGVARPGIRGTAALVFSAPSQRSLGLSLAALSVRKQR